jgi:hypothetical protein
VPGHGTRDPVRGPLPTKESPLIEPTSLFSAPEGQTRRSTAASPPPVTNPFRAPDFGEDETFPPEEFPEFQEPGEVERPAQNRRASRPRRRAA